MSDFTTEEVMVAALARTLNDKEVGFTGLPTGSRTATLIVGVPIAAMGLAKLTHAPNFTIMLSGWIIDPIWNDAPTGGFFDEFEDRWLGWDATATLIEEEVLSMAKTGLIDIGFISGAQVDKYGNVNSVAIGDYKKPKVRLVGPIFLQQHMALYHREVIMMKHEKRRFVDKVDFITAAGYLDGPEARDHAGLKRGGPCMCMTDLAIMDFEEKSKRMRLVSVHPGVTVEDVVKNTGFELIIPDNVSETQKPTHEELDLIRNKIDPNGVLLSR